MSTITNIIKAILSRSPIKTHSVSTIKEIKTYPFWVVIRGGEIAELWMAHIVS